MTTWVLIAVGVAAVVVRRTRGEPLNLRDLAVPPLALLGIGGYALTKVHLGAVDVLWLTVSSLTGLAMGVLRGSSVHLFTRDGNLWQRYTPRTFGYWGLSLAVNLAVGYTASLYTDTRPITLSIGIGLLGETIPVALHALRPSTQTPTALPKTTA